MIFSVQPAYRNCPSCGKKVPYYGGDLAEQAVNMIMGQPLLACTNCRAAFPEKGTQQIQAIMEICKARMKQPIDPLQLLFSTFSVGYQKHYCNSYGIPLFSLEELLTVENLMHTGRYRMSDAPTPWIGSFRHDDLKRYPALRVFSWQKLVWDQMREVFLAGDDEGPREITTTSFE